MPKRTDIKSICIIGAGPIIIGQACEFDYSGVQACKALKEEGYRVILVNSNPATIMTDPGLADATYVEPITPAIVAKILEKERPDALLPTMGGQTALNTALKLFHDGTLDRLGVKLIGAKADVIEKAEDRLLFRDAMDKIGLESPKSRMVKSEAEAADALAYVGLPAIIRPSFTLAGTGGGIAYNKAEYVDIVRGGLRASPVGEVLVEESVLGWKEYEMEVVRDCRDNCIIICSIENIDPMGIHTGDSVTVAPALTLTDKEYQLMRNASIAVLREIGVDTGGSNVQFAVNPENGRVVVIEMNPRVSRSSALASKATGFPIAKIAAKLAVGYTLDELDNDITGSTPASFEPTIDYVVTKMPRFAFEKFPGADALLTTSMKSVGEAMSIGRSFAESVQKALRSMETGLTGFDEVDLTGGTGVVDPLKIRAALSKPTHDRILVIAQAFRHGLTVEEIHAACRVDPWFLRQIEEVVQAEAGVKAAVQKGGLAALTQRDFAKLKAQGFSDARLATLTGATEAAVAAARRGFNIRPVFKRIDTCAAEFASKTPYMYSTYEGDGSVAGECESEPTDKKKVVILGGGPNRIGQGIEFDYCCVHAVYALREAGYETIMVNCNPETVSTDYDTADRLYFEPLTAEDVIELVRTEQANGEVLGVIVQLGGQTPLKLARDLEEAGIPILGTSPDAIDLAEDRERFQQLLHKLNLRQPANGLARSLEEAEKVAEQIGFPVVIRPSYVLGGRAMEIVHDQAGLKRYMGNAVKVSGKNPVLIDSYLQDAIEVDVDAVCDGTQVYVAGVMEHIEEAGIHSGDSACALPPYTLPKPVVDELSRQAEALAHGLNVVGLMNIQFAIKANPDGNGPAGQDIYILEVNPRASRTVPFVAKATGTAIAKIAARVMAGEKLADFKLGGAFPSHTAVKEAVFPFNRFPGVDILLGPEMRSTGEVMGLDPNFAMAFAKAQLGAGVTLPTTGTVFISVRERDKPHLVPVARRLVDMGFRIVATCGTAKVLSAAGIPVSQINKVLEGQPHIVDAMIDGEVQLVFNTTEGAQAVSDSFSLRRTALVNNIPYYTTVAGARAAVDAISALRTGSLEVAPLQSYLSGTY
ncbi:MULTISPECIES: carbamoyl-phosphate synthase large subunit [Nitrospirillum]|uniref:Carbamoyl phosphate synthase large chain n=1 Tax=Nitrospirillum amazonense TaxID=28077 RepID=A0A560FZ44_9PROT|nr:carbamoyl-phosphate synthase large subunit [Nitrospirillum amazonense]MEC4592415.1 carbamoyl-phosphate synthase large subunit [Nitrospirillum amazonense]TWB26907.1 carbamoyl-phosphate synthase large subunit [Nitrospirillum amazonense]